MQKLSKTSNKVLITSVIVIVIIGLLGGLYAGRSTVSSHLADLFYSDAVKKLVSAQEAALAEPFDAFHISSPQVSSGCSSDIPSLRYIQIDCSASKEGYVKLGETADDKARNIAAAQTLEKTLASNGYTAGTNGVTLTSLVSGTYEGKDYSPDAYYQKKIGNKTCTLDTFIAYANPAPKAIRMVLSCDRNLSIAGDLNNPESTAPPAKQLAPETVSQAKSHAAAPSEHCSVDNTADIKVNPTTLSQIKQTALAHLIDVPAGTTATVRLTSYSGNIAVGSIVYPDTYGSYNFTMLKGSGSKDTTKGTAWSITSFSACSS